MRVVRVIAKLEPGGAQLMMLRLLRELRGRGIGSELYCGWATPAGVELARSHGAEPHVWGEGGDLQWVPDPRFAAWLAPRLAAADVVHAHMFGAWWAAARALPPKVPLVASEHNGYAWPDRPRIAELREGLARVDVFFAHGPGARAAVIEHGLPPERVREGVSLVAGTDARPAPGLPSSRIVFAGRLAPDKGPDVLVEALGLLGRAAPATLILGDGRLRDGLERRVRELGLADRVQFRGWVDDPGPYIAGAAVLAIPSREEAFSQTAIVGLALGVPVIGTEVEGLPATVGRHGILVPPEDPPALAAALQRVLRGDGPRTPPLRELAERYAPARVAAVYERTYRGLVARGAARTLVTS